MTKSFFFKIWLKELNFSCLKRIERFFPIRCVSKKGKINMTLRIELFWKSMTPRIQPSFVKWLKELYVFFFNMTQRIEPFLKHDSQIWTIFVKYDSKNRTLFSFTKNMTLRIEPLWKNMIHSENPTLLNLCILLKELDFLRDPKTWAFLFFQKFWLSRTELFFSIDSKNWTFFFFKNTTQRIELF